MGICAVWQYIHRLAVRVWLRRVPARRACARQFDIVHGSRIHELHNTILSAHADANHDPAQRKHGLGGSSSVAPDAFTVTFTIQQR